MTINKIALCTFPYNFFSLLKLANHALHGSESWYTCVFQLKSTTMNKKWPRARFLITTFSLLKLANHTGEVCLQVYLSVSMIATSLRHSIHTGIFMGACPLLNDLH